jgi:hypothetical protein
MTTTIQNRAAEANSWLGRTSRGEREIVAIKDGAPQWVTDMCRAAHGDMMPDDWRFEMIEDALIAIENGDEFFDIDSLYPYTHDRLNWFASRNDRHCFCDEAANTWGPFNSIMDQVAAGMSMELEEIKGLLVAWFDADGDSDDE